MMMMTTVHAVYEIYWTESLMTMVSLQDDHDAVMQPEEAMQMMDHMRMMMMMMGSHALLPLVVVVLVLWNAIVCVVMVVLVNQQYPSSYHY